MSTISRSPTESLRCPACDHSFTTSKTVEKPDSLEVKCPKCETKSALVSWRTVVFDASTGRDADKQPDDAVHRMIPKAPDRNWFENFVSFVLIYAGAVGMLFCVIGLLFVSFNSSDREYIKETISNCFTGFFYCLLLSGVGIIVDRVTYYLPRS